MYLAGRGMIPTHNSFAGANKLVSLHLHNAFDLGGAPTFVWSACVAPTYQNAKDFDIPAIQDALGRAGLRFRWRAQDMEFWLPDCGTREQPSRILVRTADTPERITGWQVGAGWGDEAARWKCDFDHPQNDPLLQFFARVRDYRANFIQRMFTYTNEGDGTRIYREFHSGKPDHALYTARTADNELAQDFYTEMREQLNDDLARQYLEGEAIELRGRLMYAQFSQRLHVCDGLKCEPELPLQLACDFNIAPGMHAIVGQHNTAADELSSVWEIHERRLDVRGVVRELQTMCTTGPLKGWQWTYPLEVFGDATGQSQWAGTGETCYDILTAGLEAADIPYVIRVPHANPPVVDRVNAVNCALRDMSGCVHWRIHPRCERLLQDLQSMRYDEKGQPDKRNATLSHASDAEGYRIHYLRPIRRHEDDMTQARFIV
jgi:hypothetical protein